MGLLPALWVVVLVRLPVNKPTQALGHIHGLHLLGLHLFLLLLSERENQAGRELELVVELGEMAAL